MTHAWPCSTSSPVQMGELEHVPSLLAGEAHLLQSIHVHRSICGARDGWGMGQQGIGPLGCSILPARIAMPTVHEVCWVGV